MTTRDIYDRHLSHEVSLTTTLGRFRFPISDQGMTPCLLPSGRCFSWVPGWGGVSGSAGRAGPLAVCWFRSPRAPVGRCRADVRFW
jgi:hypothetical protein